MGKKINPAAPAPAAVTPVTSQHRQLRVNRQRTPQANRQRQLRANRQYKDRLFKAIFGQANRQSAW